LAQQQQNREQILARGNIRSAHKVLVDGASGSVSTFAVQLAKYFGAKVTAACSTPNLELMQSLGTDKSIDYIQEDFAKNAQTYDVIFDAVGKSSALQSKGSRKKTGVYLSVKSSTSEKSKDLISSKNVSRKDG
jgi:NADPH:quinone reductase-like Zn-dependent oxidoreductase